jgi:hypothetical protein
VQGLPERRNVLRILQQLQTTLFQDVLWLPYHVAVRRFGFNANATSRYSSTAVYQHPTRQLDYYGGEYSASRHWLAEMRLLITFRSDASCLRL